MLLPDVNILVGAFREDLPDYHRLRDWLERLANSRAAFGFPDLICSGFLRVVTNPAIFVTPTPIDEALAYIEDFRNQAAFVRVSPGDRHWQIFTELCRLTNARGNLVPDAYFAALAIESGNEWVTMDRGFSRFPGLRWQRPL